MRKSNGKSGQKTSPQSKFNRPIKQEPESPPGSPQSPRRSQLQRSRQQEENGPSTSQQEAPKRHRSVTGHMLTAGEIKQEEGTVALRRRRTLKHGEVAPPKCIFCQIEQQPEHENLQECVKCKGNYHIKKCLKYKGELADSIARCETWHCPRCINCSACGSYITDPTNIECSGCSKAFHGRCVARSVTPLPIYGQPWYCELCYASKRRTPLTCHKARHRHKPRPPVPKNKQRSRSPTPTEELKFEDGAADELMQILDERKQIFQKFHRMAGFSSREPTTSESPGETSEKSRTETKRKSSTPSNASEVLQLEGERRIEQLMLPVDRDMYERAKKDAYLDEPDATPVAVGQWLHLASGMASKSIYKSAFEEPLASAPHLFACKFCHYTTNLKNDFMVHFHRCKLECPPGKEIYRHDKLAFFEVDGAKERRYCQKLCLLAKLFIASKTLYEEVETFIFYVLCEQTDEGDIWVGYFSKEKNPSKNNNLSCLMVLPTAQKKGYGQMLIDMSYELSRIEHRVGHPEHPLSDLGILAYRTYWRSSLLCYLRSKKITDKISLKEMCLQTRITQVDIVNQLMLDNIIVLKDGTYYIKIGKRALKYPLSQFRRRAVDVSKIKWKADATCEGLDPRKINTYV